MQLTSNKFNIVPEDNLRQIILLLVFAAIMVFIRTFPVWNRIFTDWPGDYGDFVNFSADDAVYHMRFVHNTLYHMPWRVFFDPFTLFPYGCQIHFGPLFTLIIAFAALIAGLGHPTPELVNVVGAYTPVVMGALCLIPVYFIARNLFGKTAAIFTTFVLTFLPGAFLQRTALGFADHHAAEVLFSSMTCAFLLRALTIITIDRRFLIHAILAGFSFGLFILIWPAALMFGAFFLIFFITQLTIDHSNDRSTSYLLLLAIIIYTLPTIMVLPYALMNPHFELPYYSLTQPLILVAMLAMFLISYITHLACKGHKLIRNLYSLVLFAVFALTILILYRYAPKLYTVARDGCKMLFEPIPGMRTVSEVRPLLLDRNGGGLTIKYLWLTYFWATPLAILGLGHLIYRTYKNAHPAEVLLLIWSIAMILAAIAQCRFSYYLAINIAILVGCYAFFPFITFLSKLKPKQKFRLRLQKIAIYTSLSIFALLIVDPILMLLMDDIIPSGAQISRERYDTYMWLKKHTPDPQGKVIRKDFNYTSGYYPIPKNPSAPYDYPKSAYGVMSWWDIGHQITYIAERIPNTNTFQLGIVEKNGVYGAAPFFTSTDEEKAVKNLDKLGSRYILIDYGMAININGMGVWINETKGWDKTTKITQSLPGKTYNMKVPIDSEKFNHSMLSRLFYDDADRLKHFRLIHESDGKYKSMIRRAVFKPEFHPDTIDLSFEDYKEATKDFAKINRGFWANDEKTVFAYSARPPVKEIKIFEKVKGATIIGTAPRNIKNGTTVSLSLKLKTKFDRIFTYTQTAKVKNGKYKFVVPYPTAKMHGDDYNYDIKPIGKYKLKIGTKTTAVFVPEKAIMLGKTIKVID